MDLADDGGDGDESDGGDDDDDGDDDRTPLWRAGGRLGIAPRYRRLIRAQNVAVARLRLALVFFAGVAVVRLAGTGVVVGRRSVWLPSSGLRVVLGAPLPSSSSAGETVVKKIATPSDALCGRCRGFVPDLPQSPLPRPHAPAENNAN